MQLPSRTQSSDRPCGRLAEIPSPSVTDLLFSAEIPLETKNEIKQAILQLDDDMLCALIEEIRDQNSAFADILSGLADKYEYDEILELIDMETGE